MKPEINFIKKLEAFFDDEFNDYTKNRIKVYLKEFREEIPPVVINKEIMIKEPLLMSGANREIKRESIYKVYPTINDLHNDAKEICELYQIDLDEFMNRKNMKAKANIADVRKKFCQMAFERYFCSTNMLAKFFKVHHSTISFYVHGKKLRKIINSQTKNTLYV